jgi:predicted transcriptional regulator
MYTKKFTALTPEQIKKINASALAKTFNCTQSYISRILKLQEEPNSKKPKKILEAARVILESYEVVDQKVNS